MVWGIGWRLVSSSSHLLTRTRSHPLRFVYPNAPLTVCSAWCQLTESSVLLAFLLSRLRCKLCCQIGSASATILDRSLSDWPSISNNTGSIVADKLLTSDRNFPRPRRSKCQRLVIYQHLLIIRKACCRLYAVLHAWSNPVTRYTFRQTDLRQ
jgi:hypothetical protein